MPRSLKLTKLQEDFIIAHAHEGGNWLAEKMGLDRAALYQWGTNNGVSLKRKTYPVKERKRIFSKWPRPWRQSRKFIIERDGLNCHYCGRELSIAEVQIDHIVPRVRGGTDSPDNLVVSCARCNNFKGACCYSCPEFRNAINV